MNARNPKSGGKPHEPQVILAETRGTVIGERAYVVKRLFNTVDFSLGEVLSKAQVSSLISAGVKVTVDGVR